MICNMMLLTFDLIIKNSFYLCELCGSINLYRINFYHMLYIQYNTLLEMLKHINKNSVYMLKPILTDSHNFLMFILMYLNLR